MKKILYICLFPLIWPYWLVKLSVRIFRDAKNNSENSFIAMPTTLNGVPLSYNYNDVDVCIIRGQSPNFSLISVGDSIEFKQEPNNPYDSNAVIVSNTKTKIGYLYRGALQDMVNDYLDREDPIIAKVREVDKVNKSVKIAIAFYNESRMEKQEDAAESVEKYYKKTPDIIEMGYFLHKSGDEIFILNEDEILFSNTLISAIKESGINETVRLTYISGNFIDYNLISQDKRRFQIGRIKLRGKVRKIYNVDERTWRENISVNDAVKSIPKWVKRAQQR